MLISLTARHLTKGLSYIKDDRYLILDFRLFEFRVLMLGVKILDVRH